MRFEFLFLPITLLVYYTIIWRLVVRTPGGRAIVTQYAPQGGMTPAEMRYLHAGMTDDKSVAAVIAHLAARRLISVSPHGSEYLVTRLVDELPRDPSPGSLPEEERDAFKAMFALSENTEGSAVRWTYGPITMQNAFRLRPDQGDRLLRIRAAISAALDRRLGETYFRLNLEYSVPAVAFSSALAIGSLASFPHADNLVLMTVLFVVWPPASAASPFLTSLP
ncbi:MAG: hypothetical protein WBW38_08080 [Candidatus Sulfotelmatobacter sp.]